MALLWAATGLLRFATGLARFLRAPISVEQATARVRADPIPSARGKILPFRTLRQ